MDFDSELDKFAHKFLGYGNLNAPIWFIGMEEGMKEGMKEGGKDRYEEIKLRLQAWKDMGYPKVADVADFHVKIGHVFLFRDPVKLQKTWVNLIKFQLSLTNLDCSKEEARAFQRDKWGRSNSPNALLELMPLPSPGLKEWFYNEFFNLPYLKTRDTYFDYMLPKRIFLIQKVIHEFKPKIILFYGSRYTEHWKKIAGLEFKNLPEEEFSYGKKDNTCFIITKHPVAHIKKIYFEKIGKIISKIK